MTTGEWITAGIAAANFIGLFVLAVLGFLAKRKIEWVKTELSKEFFNHSLKFQYEFEINKYLWQAASHFSQAVRDYHCASISFSPPPPQERALGKMAPILSAKYDVEETLRIRAPFLSPEVKAKAESLLALANPPDSGEAFEAHKIDVDTRLLALEDAIHKHINGEE